MSGAFEDSELRSRYVRGVEDNRCRGAFVFVEDGGAHIVAEDAKSEPTYVVARVTAPCTCDLREITDVELATWRKKHGRTISEE